GLREVAIIFLAFLLAHLVGEALVAVVAAGLGFYSLSRREDGLLTLDLVVDGLLDKAEGVQVLDLDPGAEFLLSLRSDRDIGVAAQRALLHVAVADIEGDEEITQDLYVLCSLLPGTEVGSAYDLDKGNTGAV